jgi:hypothetical protein
VLEVSNAGKLSIQQISNVRIKYWLTTERVVGDLAGCGKEYGDRVPRAMSICMRLETAPRDCWVPRGHSVDRAWAPCDTQTAPSHHDTWRQARVVTPSSTVEPRSANSHNAPRRVTAGCYFRNKSFAADERCGPACSGQRRVSVAADGISCW